MAVLERAPADLGARSQAEAQRVRQLIEEHRHAVIDLRDRWRGTALGPPSPGTAG